MTSSRGVAVESYVRNPARSAKSIRRNFTAKLTWIWSSGKKRTPNGFETEDAEEAYVAICSESSFTVQRVRFAEYYYPNLKLRLRIVWFQENLIFDLNSSRSAVDDNFSGEKNKCKKRIQMNAVRSGKFRRGALPVLHSRRRLRFSPNFIVTPDNLYRPRLVTNIVGSGGAADSLRIAPNEK